MHRAGSVLIFCVLLSNSSAKNAPFYCQVLLCLCFSAFSVWGYLCWPQQWIESRRLNGRAKSTLCLGHQACTKDPDCHGLDRAHQEFWMMNCPPSPDPLASFGDVSPSCASVKAASWGVYGTYHFTRNFIFMLQCESPAPVFTVDVMMSKQCKAPQGERRTFWTTAYAGELVIFILNLTQEAVHISDTWFTLTEDPVMKVSASTFTSLEDFSAFSCFWSLKRQCQYWSDRRDVVLL